MAFDRGANPDRHQVKDALMILSFFFPMAQKV
jgi:hypothetical protein